VCLPMSSSFSAQTAASLTTGEANTGNIHTPVEGDEDTLRLTSASWEEVVRSSVLYFRQEVTYLGDGGQKRHFPSINPSLISPTCMSAGLNLYWISRSLAIVNN